MKTLLFIVVIAASLAWQCAQWNECRAMGFSTFYCAQHVS